MAPTVQSSFSQSRANARGPTSNPRLLRGIQTVAKGEQGPLAYHDAPRDPCHGITTALSRSRGLGVRGEQI